MHKSIYMHFKIINVLTSILLFADALMAFTPPHMTLTKSLKMNIPKCDRRALLHKSLIFGTFIGCPKQLPALTQDELNQIDIYANTVSSVCFITTEYNVSQSSAYGQATPKGIGSGFVYDTDGHIVTNFHVINYAKNATVKMINSKGTTKEYIPILTGYDIDKDIAVLKIDVKQSDDVILRPIPFSTNEDIKVGQNCFAIGSPFAKEWSFTMGIISGKGRQLTAPSGRKIVDVIQSDTPINKGNSGGCLLDTSGKLIGMNTAIVGGEISSGISLTIPVDTIKQTVTEILKKGIIEHPTLGITYLERLPTASEANKSGVPFITKGVIVLDVSATQDQLKPAQRLFNGKFILGDVIVAINGTDIDNAEQLLDYLDACKARDTIKIKVLRGNDLEPMILDVTLGSDIDTTIGLQSEILPS